MCRHVFSLINPFNAALLACFPCSVMHALQATAQAFGEFQVLHACLQAAKGAEPSVADALGLLIPLFALRRLSVDLASLLTERLVSLEFAAALPGLSSYCHHVIYDSDAGIVGHYRLRTLRLLMNRCHAEPGSSACSTVPAGELVAEIGVDLRTSHCLPAVFSSCSSAVQIVNAFAIPGYVHQAPLAGDWEVWAVPALKHVLIPSCAWRWLSYLTGFMPGCAGMESSRQQGGGSQLGTWSSQTAVSISIFSVPVCQCQRLQQQTS